MNALTACKQSLVVGENIAVIMSDYRGQEGSKIILPQQTIEKMPCCYGRVIGMGEQATEARPEVCIGDIVLFDIGEGRDVSILNSKKSDCDLVYLNYHSVMQVFTEDAARAAGLDYPKLSKIQPIADVMGLID